MMFHNTDNLDLNVRQYDSATGTTFEADGETVDYVTFTKNDQYWGGAPSLDSIRVQRYADSMQILSNTDKIVL